jgi:hypothetical protein
MGFVLDSNATIMCPHGGTVKAVPSNTVVKAGSGFALLQTDTFTVTGCPFTTPAGAPAPCTMVQWLTAAVFTKVNGTPVLLSDSVSLCIGALGPAGPVTVSGFQTVVQGT